MKLGLNLSFAVKRWMKPDELAKLCSDLGVKYIQFTWDLCDPWWPEQYRDHLAVQYARAFRREGLELTGTFGGIANYTYPHLLAPMEEMRLSSMMFLKRAIDMTLAMGIKVIGMPLGGMDYEDANNPICRERRYQSALVLLQELAEYGKEKGLQEIMIEATPLITEFPHSPEASMQLMKDLDGKTAIPIRLLVDWGHALFMPLLQEQANMEFWLKTCSQYISAIHLQQCDGLWDRHWDFTHEGGIITPALIDNVMRNAKAEHIIQYLEVVPAFEAFDDDVLNGMKRSMTILRQVFDE